MNPVVFFDDTASGVASIVGGKGNNLIALTAAGFPVPPGFVVTAEAYGQFLQTIDWLDQELAAFVFDRPDRLREQCEQLRGRLSQVKLPEPVRKAVSEALAR